MAERVRQPAVFMMDLWATVPYYTAYLSSALERGGTPVMVGSITYYLDTDCFRSRGLELDPGLLDVVGRYRLPRRPRQVLKLGEAMLNLGALSLRFLLSPPAIVHVQYLPMLKWPLPADLWFLRLLRWRGARILLTVHDLVPHDSGDRYREIFRRLYLWVDGIICHSDQVRSRLQVEFGVAPEKIWVIPHGPFFFDQPAAAREPALGFAPEGGVQVLWQGILFPYKGVDLLLDAWATVEAEMPSATLVIAGTGSPEMLESVRAQVDRLHLSRVRLDLRFLSSEELVAAYRSADIVVYPYRAITTSGALATGLALGKAVVASDLPVFRELLTDGKNALLVPPGDAGALAEAILRLAHSPEGRHQLEEEVREMRFGQEVWPEIARKTAEVYTSLMGQPD